MNEKTNSLYEEMKQEYRNTGVPMNLYYWWDGYLKGLTRAEYLTHPELAWMIVKNDELRQKYIKTF